MKKGLLQIAMLGLAMWWMTPPASAQAEKTAEEKLTAVHEAWIKAPDYLESHQLISEAYEDPELAPHRDSLAELLSTTKSMIGLHRDAESLSISRAGTETTALPEGAITLPAAEAIVEVAKSHRVVMLNEAHTIARTRLLTYELLAPLRKAGYTHLAMETLTDFDPIQQRGYPTQQSGFYSREPVFGEIIRQALALGYVLVPYEYQSEDTGRQARETGQADKLAALLRNHPDARLLVHAGHGHISKEAGSKPDDVRLMAHELKRLTGIEPLSIEQTRMWDHPDPTKRHPAYEPALALWRSQHSGQEPTSPFVLRKKDGGLWALRPQSNDISVFMAPWTDDQAWRQLGGWRHPVKVRKHGCSAFPCLVEARYQHESDKAVPADRQLIFAPGTLRLWLRNGCYRINAIPSHTKAEGEAGPVCFHTSSSASAGTASVQWKP